MFRAKRVQANKWLWHCVFVCEVEPNFDSSIEDLEDLHGNRMETEEEELKKAHSETKTENRSTINQPLKTTE